MLNQLTISELTAKLAAREVSAREVTQSCLDRITRVDGKIHAFLSYDTADALAQADGRKIACSPKTPLLLIVRFWEFPWPSRTFWPSKTSP